MFENPWRGRQARNYTKKCSENSGSQIVFQTDIFRKLTLGAPENRQIFADVIVIASPYAQIEFKS